MQGAAAIDAILIALSIGLVVWGWFQLARSGREAEHDDKVVSIGGRPVSPMRTQIYLAFLGAIAAHFVAWTVVAMWPAHSLAFPTRDFVSGDGMLSATVSPQPSGPSVCPVHYLRMSEVETEFVYGMIEEIDDPMGYALAHPEEPSAVVRKAEFPYASTFRWGGCVQGPVTTTFVYVCPECVRAEKAWKPAPR